MPKRKVKGESKQERIASAKYLLDKRNVTVGYRQIKPHRYTGINTWGIIDFLVNHHGFTLLPWWFEGDVK